MNWLTERVRGMFDLEKQMEHAREIKPVAILVAICAILGLAAYASIRHTPYYFVCHFLFHFMLPFVLAACSPRSPLLFLLGCFFSAIWHFGHELYYDPLSKAHGIIDIDHLIAGGMGIMVALPVYFIWLNPPASKTPGN